MVALIPLVSACMLALVGQSTAAAVRESEQLPFSGSAKKNLCPASKKLVPSPDEAYYEPAFFRTPEYKNHSVQVWADAVRIPTQSFDDMAVLPGDDERWDVMYAFEKYILKNFPTLNATAELVHVNTHGLIFIIQGSNDTLKPIFLAGHQDVVPVPKETRFEWDYSPFSGYYDGDWVWGRGVCDCKNSVTAELEALEALLKQGFEPERTIILGLGFDEEIGGFQGASYIGDYLLDRYGKDGIAIIIDEGFGVDDIEGGRYAMPGMGEKGHLSVAIELLTSGGHSSVPPRHTGVGIMGEVMVNLESTPYPLILVEENPFYQQLQCEAEYSTKMSLLERNDIKNMGWDKLAMKRVLARLDKDIMTRYLASTTQALNIVEGGIKINALPEKTTLKIDHRIAYGSSVEAVEDRITKVVTSIAKKYGLSVQGFDDAKVQFSGDLPTGYFKLNTMDNFVQAPVTPIDTPAFELLAGTSRHIFEDFAIYPNADEDTDPEVHVTPSIMTANTDTKHYWDLTKNIFRYTPTRADSCINWHTVNERGTLDAHVETVAWFYQFLRNAEEYGQELGF